MKRLFTFLSIALLCLGLSAAVSEKTASYGLLLSDNGNTIVMNSSSNLIVYLPALGSDNIGYTVTIMKKGTGQVKIQAPLADYVGDSTVNGYLQNTTASTDASVTLHLGKLHYWYITGATGVWATDTSSSPYGVESPTYGTVYATTFDTNVAAAAVTLAGTTLAADGTDSNIDITLTPKGTGEVNLPKVDIDAGVAQLTTLGVTNLANNVLYVDGTRTDTYTADGSQLLPYKTVLAALTAINASSGESWTVYVAPGTYSDNLTITGPRHLRIVGMGGVVLSGTILINSGVGTYDRIEFVGAETGFPEKGPALTISGAMTCTRLNDSLIYLSFKGCYISGNLATDTDGTWVIQYDGCRINGTITGTFSASGHPAILLVTRGWNEFAGAIGGKLAFYDAIGADFYGAINTTPYYASRFRNCSFSSTITIAPVTPSDSTLIYVDGVSLKAMQARTPTLTGATYSLLEYVGTETYAGVNELSTDAEAVTGTATDKVLTPANLVAHLAAPAAIGGTTPAAITGTTVTGTTVTTGGAGAAAATGNVATENALGTVHSTVLTLTDVALTLTATGAAVGFGNVKLYDFPEGYVYFIGAVADLAITSADADLGDTWNGDISFGTAADADGSLAGTEVNVIPSTATPAATAKATTGDCVSTATEHAIVDGHSTALDLYLNLLADAADIADDSTAPVAISGTITVTWIKLGDN